MRRRRKCAGVVTDLTSQTSSLFDQIQLDSLEARAGQNNQVKLELPYSISGEWGVTAKDHYTGLDRYLHINQLLHVSMYLNLPTPTPTPTHAHEDLHLRVIAPVPKISPLQPLRIAAPGVVQALLN